MTEPLYATDPSPARAPPPAPVSNLPTAPAATPPAILAEIPAAAAPQQGGFWRLLFGGARAILMLPVRPGTVTASAGSCILMLLTLTAIGIVGEHWLLSPDELTFNWASLRSAWFDLPILLLGGAWLAQGRKPRKPRRTRETRMPNPGVPSLPPAATPPLHFAAVMLAASVWIVAIAYGLFIADTIGWLPPSAGETIGDWIYLAAPVWSYAVAIRTIAAMNRFAPISALRRMAVLLALAMTSAWYIIDPIEPYWLAPAQPEIDAYVDADLGAGAGDRLRA